jgi:hypothetical protein
MVVRSSGAVDVSSGTVADVDYDGDGDKARGREGECMRVPGVVAMLRAGVEGEAMTEETRRRRTSRKTLLGGA